MAKVISIGGCLPLASSGLTENRYSHDLHFEELRRSGFTVVTGVLKSTQLQLCREAIDALLVTQAEPFAHDELESIGELDIVRAPLVDDDFFLFSVAMAPAVLDLVEQVVGDYCLLHLQNAIVNRPDRAHHQSSWHRDLPYLDRVSSAPLALSALFCIDEFSVESGATSCIPGSHLVADPPPEAFLATHAVSMEAGAGDVIIFDSMLLHRAGANQSANPRRGINNVYSVGIIRQQIDLPRAMDGRHADDPRLAVFLGYASNAPTSADEYRVRRLRRSGSA